MRVPAAASTDGAFPMIANALWRKPIPKRPLNGKGCSTSIVERLWIPNIIAATRCCWQADAVSRSFNNGFGGLSQDCSAKQRRGSYTPSLAVNCTFAVPSHFYVHMRVPALPQRKITALSINKIQTCSPFNETTLVSRSSNMSPAQAFCMFRRSFRASSSGYQIFRSRRPYRTRLRVHCSISLLFRKEFCDNCELWTKKFVTSRVIGEGYPTSCQITTFSFVIVCRNEAFQQATFLLGPPYEVWRLWNENYRLRHLLAT